MVEKRDGRLVGQMVPWMVAQMDVKRAEMSDD